MPDEDKIFGGILVLDFRKGRRHVKTIYCFLFSTRFSGLTHVESKRSQLEIFVTSLTCFNTQFKVKEGFQLLIAIKVKNPCPENILQFL